MKFDYFYDGQSEQYAFFRIPKFLFTEKRFMGISNDAKALYGLLLDRASLSKENGWIDELGRVYVFYTNEAVQQSIGCADKKATKLMVELEESMLIERIRQGQGKPIKIYVKSFRDD